MGKWEEHVKKVIPYVPGEQKNIPDLIKLNTNENPYPPSPRVKKALEEFDYTTLTKYPNPGVSGLVKALADYHGVSSDRVFVGVGSDDVLAMCFATFFTGEEPLFFPDITYSFYDVWAEFFDVKYKKIPVNNDLDIVISDYREKNGGVVIPNPNAPTGLAKGILEIEELIEANQDVVVVIDEAYVDFGAQTAIDLCDKYENLLVIRTFSKSRALAGNRIGYAIGSKKIISYLWAARNSFNSYTISGLSANLAVGSVEDDDYFKDNLSKVIKTREWFKGQMKELGFDFPDSFANFLFVKHRSKSAKEIFDYLNSKNILVRYFNAPRIDNYLRISIGTMPQMETLVGVLKEIL